MDNNTEKFSSGSRTPGNLQRVGIKAWWLLQELVKRSYAVALILIILWLSWQAVYYLVSSLMLPAKPPPLIVDIPTRLTGSALMRSESGVNGAQAMVNPRSPLSHYHRLDKGFQPDHLNGCTISQCHAPLPHGKNKADRAFLNMHATSIHCGVCHSQTDQKPMLLGWYDLKTGRAREQAPALLRAYAWLTSPSTRDATTFSNDNQAEIVRLLRAAADEAYDEPALVSLAEHLAAVRAASDEFRRFVQVARDTVRGHFRGEYGAKLALMDPHTKQPVLGKPGNEAAVRDYLARRDTLTEQQRAALLEQVHLQRRQPTLHCAECHRPEGSLVDLVSLGYPPARIQAISSPLVTDAIDHIVEGKPFHLPEFMGTRDLLKP